MSYSKKYLKKTQLSISNFNNRKSTPRDEQILKTYNEQLSQKPWLSRFSFEDYKSDVYNYLIYQNGFLPDVKAEIKKKEKSSSIFDDFGNRLFLYNDEYSYSSRYIKKTPYSVNRFNGRKIFPLKSEIFENYESLVVEKYADKFSAEDYYNDVYSFFLRQNKDYGLITKWPESFENTKNFENYIAEFESPKVDEFKELFGFYQNFLCNEQFEPVNFRKKNVGIYLMYIDVPMEKFWNEGRVLPFYVGKSNAKAGMGSRFSNHKSQIKKIMEEIKTEDYKTVINSGRWNGKHLYSKIASLLQKFALNYDAVKFRVIESFEQIEELELLALEEDYIEMLNTIRFGLNQFHFIVEYHKLNGLLANQFRNTNKEQQEENKKNSIGLVWIMTEEIPILVEFIEKNIFDWLPDGFSYSNFNNLLMFMKSFTENYYIGPDNLKEELLKRITEFQTAFKFKNVD